MTTAPLATTDMLVLDYLAALWAASEDLPPEARDDLMRTVTDYISLRHDLTDDPALVLARLGPPEHLAAAVRRGGMPTRLHLPVTPATPPAPRVPETAGGPEHAAIMLLVAGTFALPVVSPVAGLLLATGSARWTAAQKAAAWTLTIGSAFGALMVALMVAGLGGGGGLFFLTCYLGAGAGAAAAGLTLRLGLRE